MRVVSIAASTSVRSFETEVVVDDCCGVTIHTFSHTAVNNPGLIGVGGRDRSFLFVACNSFHCESVNNGSGAGSSPLALLSCSSNVFLIAARSGYCHTALPGSRGFSTKHSDGCRGCTFMPDVFAQAHRPYRTDHTCIWGSASGLALGCGGGLCALDLWLLQNSGRAHVPVRATSAGMY